MKENIRKVFIVEDSRAITDLLVHSLTEQLKIDVIAASSLKETKEVIHSDVDSIFLAICDINLPDAPNGEVIDYIHSQGIPVIVLTGSLSDEIHTSMMGKGVIDYVVKRNLNEIQYLIESVDRLRKNQERRVMVVDDSDSTRAHICALLKSHFFRVVEACNGIDALSKLKEYNDVVLVITDYNMPKMDGNEFIVKVRETYSRDELGIIGISAGSNGMVPVKLLKSGANDFITKPFLHEEFYCRINQNIDANANYRQMKDAATKDYLTDLYNRKYVFETGEKLYQNAKRNNITLAAAMLDIDFFKRINDTYGHNIGDLALKHVSKVIASHTRQSDIVARMGGEEFCILVVNATNVVVASLLERIRSSIFNAPLLVDGATINITISSGYSMVMGDTLDDMINNADLAMYDSKKNGRNMISQFNNSCSNVQLDA